MTGDPDAATLQGLAGVFRHYAMRVAVGGPGIVLLCGDCLGQPVVHRWITAGPVTMIDLIGEIAAHSITAHPGAQG